MCWACLLFSVRHPVASGKKAPALCDAALAPLGKGALLCAGATLFALRAKALQSGAPDFMGFTGKSFSRGGLPIRGFFQRAGERGCRAFFGEHPGVRL